jgi:CheY-like chemotaxis protein
LQQIVWNLLSNAVKFTPANGEVEISLIDAGERVEIRVSDTGQGIAPDVLPHIFDRFRQADSSKTRRHGGLGLGLAIVHHLVQLHNGTITAHSDGQNKGSEFRLVIPCIVHAAGVLQGESQRALLGPSSELSRLSILVVDDDADSRNMLKMALRSQGADVATAASVREALATLDRQDWRPALLLSDLGMPEEDGYDLIRLLRARTIEDGGQLPAIALTGYAGKEEGERTLKEGYQAHLSKPVDWAELIKTIASLTQNG